MDQLLSVRELAKRLGVKPSVISMRVARKKLTCYRIDGLTRFSEGEIQRWERQRERDRKRKNFE